MATLDRNSLRPVYVQLYDILRQQIESGQLRSGERIPPEIALSKQYGISRMTARKALNELVSDGVLERQRGKGTFVVDAKVLSAATTLSSFSDTMRVLGLSVTSSIVNLELIKPSPRIIKDLQLAPGQEVAYLRRLRYVNKEPMALMSSYMSSSYYRTLQTSDLVNRPLTQIMEEAADIHIVASRDHIEASLAQMDEAELLGIEHGAPVLLIRGILYDKDHLPVRSSTVVYRGDRFRLSFVAENGTEGRGAQIKLPEPLMDYDLRDLQWLTLTFNLTE